ncbi:calcineurin B homologous protein 3 isoform X8 [Bubalus bubalis]|uniref:calcineurin B homologous protein 3 isoform X8 n=1 Tax=Bubalus bubalis TaxID=89462 RepID=UPI001E1B947B|nr:calcineurin B homologous protein 3 isoform X8 [Bubalus bubalis]
MWLTRVGGLPLVSEVVSHFSAGLSGLGFLFPALLTRGPLGLQGVEQRPWLLPTGCQSHPPSRDEQTCLQQSYRPWEPDQVYEGITFDDFLKKPSWASRHLFLGTPCPPNKESAWGCGLVKVAENVPRPPCGLGAHSTVLVRAAWLSLQMLRATLSGRASTSRPRCTSASLTWRPSPCATDCPPHGAPAPGSGLRRGPVCCGLYCK